MHTIVFLNVGETPKKTGILWHCWCNITAMFTHSKLLTG